MPIPRRRLLAASATLALPLPAFAQGWPNRPISIVVPFPPGGSNDLLARPLALKLQREEMAAAGHKGGPVPSLAHASAVWQAHQRSRQRGIVGGV